jgi:hypothetical protein
VNLPRTRRPLDAELAATPPASRAPGDLMAAPRRRFAGRRSTRCALVAIAAISLAACADDPVSPADTAPDRCAAIGASGTVPIALAVGEATVLTPEQQACFQLARDGDAAFALAWTDTRAIASSLTEGEAASLDDYGVSVTEVGAAASARTPASETYIK